MKLDADVREISPKLGLPAVTYSVDEAVRFIAAILQRLESVEDYRLQLKWWLGHILAHTQPPRGERMEMIGNILEQLWTNHHIRTSQPDLYRCEKVYRAFDGRIDTYLDWIRQRKEAFNRPVYWSDVLNDVLGGRNNPDVIGEDEADRLDYLEFERAMEAFERIMMRAREGEEEAIGVLEAMRQSIESLRLLRGGRPTTPRDDKYLAFVRNHPCVVCRQPAEAHHAFGRHGSSHKPSDYCCVPLCDSHHREIHSSGRWAFEKKHEISLFEVAFNLLHRYASGVWVTMRLIERT